MNWRDIRRFWHGPTIDDLIPIKATTELPADKAAIGDAARKLLEEPAFQLAIERVQRRLVETWRQSAAGDDEGRERTYRMHWAVEELKAELRRMVNSARPQP